MTVLSVAGLVTRLRRPVSQYGGCSQDIADPTEGWNVLLYHISKLVF